MGSPQFKERNGKKREVTGSQLVKMGESMRWQWAADLKGTIGGGGQQTNFWRIDLGKQFYKGENRGVKEWRGTSSLDFVEFRL